MPPPRRRRTGNRGLAIGLAVVVHAVFIGVLVFSLRWQNRPPEAVTAELYAPPAKAPVTETPPPPQPEQKPTPPLKPIPKPPPPPPEPKAPPKERADIALKAKQEQERKQREREEAAKKEAERRIAEKRERELAERKAAEQRTRELAEKKKLEQQRLAEAHERQDREAEALKAQAERERQEADRARQAQVEAQLKAQAKAEADARVRSELARAQADYIDRIRQKIRGNVLLPPDLAGNPEAIFDVVQLPTGEIIEATLRKSSGFRAYDEAVQRAIFKSSPLPRPDRADIFQRVLTLKFRPKEF